MQKVFNVAVDIGRKLPAPAFEVNTNDLKSVKLLITITNGQTLLDLTDTTVRIAIRKPDNHIIFQDCTVKDAANGQVEIILENQAYIMPGTHTAEIMCYKGSEVVAVSGTFSYKSTKGIMNDEAVESKSEFTTISNMMKDVQDTIDDIRKNGTGVDAKARQDIESVTAQLAEKSTQITELQHKPKLVINQIISRGGIKNFHGTNSDYVVFRDIYSVYDVSLKNTGVVYGLAEHIVNATTQGLYKSIDGGNTWTKIGDLPINQVQGVWYTSIFVEPSAETFYLQKTNTGQVETSNEIVSFFFANGEFTKIGSVNIGKNRWLTNNHSIDAKATKDFSQRVVIFGEYGTSLDTPTYSLYRTVDRGKTWTKVLEYAGDIGRVGTGVIRHFHAVQADPYTGDWWAATGDFDPQCKILRSQDEGLTWQVMFEGSQRERTCGFIFEPDYIYYGMDSTNNQDPNKTKIVRIKRSDMSRKDVATVDMAYAVYSLTKIDNPEGFLVWSCFEGANASIVSNRAIVEFYDYFTEKLYPVAYISTKGVPTNEYVGFMGASRYQNRQSGNVFAYPTSNLQQAKYGYGSVSRYIKGYVTT